MRDQSLRESIKKTFALAIILDFGAFFLYSLAEPVFVRAITLEDQVVITQVVTAGISITSPSDFSLTPLSTVQNTAVASTTWTVITNNSSGYTLSVTASGTPALQNAVNSFTDYTGPLVPWTVTNAFEFGFSALGTNTTGYGSDAESNCADAFDVPSATLGWKAFTGSTPIDIASSSATTTIAGTITTLCVATEQDSVFAPSGTYTATTTATATTNP